MSQSLLCQAIRSKSVVRFNYATEDSNGYRIVEPHMIAYNSAGHLTLSGWFRSGVTASGGEGWKNYLINQISGVEILQETFPNARPGYQPDGGKSFHDVQCAL